MVRQPLFVSLMDDVGGFKCSTSSKKGTVEEVTVDINTDVAGAGKCVITIDQAKKIVEMKCDVPDDWKITK